MKNLFIHFIITIAAISCQGQRQEQNVNIKHMDTSSIHQFKVKSLDGGIIDFADFKGKKILVVNTASACGYTPQYKDLQQLYLQYGQKLVVVGFPCNDFGGQEPGDASSIANFCSRQYQVSFPMADKVSILGDQPDPIYDWLMHKSKNGVLDAKVSWNFNKFLLDENGILLEKFGSGVKPLSEEITDLLK